MRIILVSILLTCILTSVFSQKTKVSGYVMDAVTGDTLPFVNVYFQDTKIGASSNLQGAYLIESYYASDTLVASFVGYITFKSKVNKDQDQTINILLKPSTEALPELLVLPNDENPAHPI
jgi:hypothetical protein